MSSSTSPSPNSPVVTAPPPQPSSPPSSNSPPPEPPNAPPPQPNSPPLAATPQPQSPPPTTLPPPTPPVFPPPTPAPPANVPPPQPSSPPPSDPPRSPPPLPPPSPIAPTTPPPPIVTPPPPQPPRRSPPPPIVTPPESPPPPSQPPRRSPPPPTGTPPKNSPPPPPPLPPRRSPPPQRTEPPRNSPSPPLGPPPGTATPPFPSRSPPPSSNSPPPSSTPIIVPPSLAPTGNNNNTGGTNDSGGNAPGPSRSPSGVGIGTGVTVAIVVVFSLLLLGVFGTVACCMWKRKKKASRQSSGHIMPTSVASSLESGSGLLKVQISTPNNGNGSANGTPYSPNGPGGGLGNSRSWFTYDELVNATNGFSAQNLLGQGGFGSVYKGNLADGREVAIKQLKIGGGQGEREFRAEVEIISRVHHRHLVSLVGYCISDEKRLLVYDYLPNNTLYFHLHGEGKPVMDWATRVKVAVGAARGIAYLHEDCHPRIIHRDIKSSNILLDSNFEARVSDFGLAKLAMDVNTHITTRVMGTFGYMAPEYAYSGKLTEKSDVFSFGVVLLELVTGRKPVDTSQPLGEESLVEWARPLLSHALETEDFVGLADSRLQGNFVDAEMFRLIEAAAACVRHSSEKRPKMGQVVRAFDNLVTSDLSNGMKVGESEIFNSAQQSAQIRLFRRMAFGSREYSTDFFSQTQTSWSSEGNVENSQRR